MHTGVGAKTGLAGLHFPSLSPPPALPDDRLSLPPFLAPPVIPPSLAPAPAWTDRGREAGANGNRFGAARRRDPSRPRLSRRSALRAGLDGAKFMQTMAPNLLQTAMNCS